MEKLLLPLALLLLYSTAYTTTTEQHSLKKEKSVVLEIVAETPPYLYKVLSLANWEASQKRKDLILPAKDDVFIHFSKEGQVEHVIKKHWNNASYILLKIDTSKLPGKLVLEANPGGTEKYYHLYEGSIPLTAIVEYTLVSPDTKLSALTSETVVASVQS
jgi:uncharacterized protein (DUF952 family)